MPDFDINNEPTVFVLGAGASKPYGLPLSPDLKQMILAAKDKTLLDCLKSKGHEDITISRFKEALRYGDYGTIDLFLEAKSTYREIGAFFIASAIASAENKKTLFGAKNWYTALYRIFGLDCAGTGMPPAAIVTLNYDRSLEEFLSSYLEYNCPDRIIETSRAKRASIQIVHAHGSLGDHSTVAYGTAGKTADSLNAAAQSIKIVSDSMEAAPEFETAERLIGSAQNVVFIGFGYNRVTLERLLKRVNKEKTRFFGTAFQLPDDAATDLRLFLGDRLQLAEKNADALGFLKWIGLTK